MYNKYLETFIQVADCGSFSKAAENLFISSTAIMKQMNLMEQELGLTLLNRTNQGITLTESGKEIYKSSKHIIDYATDSISKARKLENKNFYTILVGTSQICPCKPLMDLWYKISDKYPNFKIKIVPFEENHSNTLLTLNSNNIQLDCIVSPCDSKNWLKNLNFLKLRDSKLCLSVLNNHPLANKKTINFKDIKNETIMTITDGDSKTMLDLKKCIEEKCENVTIKQAPFLYDLNVFNECEEKEYSLITVDCWKDIHPAFKTIPLKFDKTIPYGILYTKNPSKYVVNFIEAIKSAL